MTSRLVTVEERRARLGRRQLLAPSCRAASSEEVVAALVALHATDAATVFLSALARLRSPSVSDVERALYDDRTLVRMHGMRQTLFVFPAELAAAIQASTTRELWVKERGQLLKNAADAGLPAEWLKRVEDETVAELRKRGTATGAELGKAVPGLRDQVLYGKGTKWETWQPASGRVLRVLGFDGAVVRGRPVGSWISSQHRWALGAGHADVPPAQAQAEVLKRWLAAFGPGTEADIKWWTGWKVTDVRKALAAVGAVKVLTEVGGGAADGAADGTADATADGKRPTGSGASAASGAVTAWVLPDDEEPVEAPEPWAALLPGLDPTAMGWQQRSWYLADGHRAELFDRSGNVGPTVWWNGEVVGGWAQRADGSIATRLFGVVGKAGEKAIAAETERWEALLGEVRVTPRFRTPLERELSG